MCSFGFDASVVRRVEGSAGLKRRLAQGAFVVAGLRGLVTDRPVPVVGDWDGERPERSLFFGVAGNSRLYGGVARLTSDARMDDGLLDLALFEARPGPAGILDAAAHLGRGVARVVTPGAQSWSDSRAERFEYRRGAAFELTTYAPLSIQVDGEYLAQAQPGQRVSLASDPGAIRMLVSAASSPLYGD
jgi:diacylglycerol kinase family enzyme